MGTSHYYRKSEEERHQIQQSVADFDDYYRNRAHRKYAPIDADRTPDEVTADKAYQEMRRQMRLMPLNQTKSWIDRVMPYILILGFLAFFLGIGAACEWVIDYVNQAGLTAW